MDNETKKRIITKLTSSRFMAFILAAALFTWLLVAGYLNENSYVNLGKWLIAGLFGAKGLEKLTNFNGNGK